MVDKGTKTLTNVSNSDDTKYFRKFINGGNVTLRVVPGVSNKTDEESISKSDYRP